jgi:uncharacterized lipoprotein YddW (UPF0748 family)
MKELRKIVSLLLFSFSFIAAFGQRPNTKEFRGIWIATINNIDWPSAPGIPVEQQKKELRELIGRIADFHLNAVFFQVRPAADAFYESSTETWSWFLSGKQGKPTEPYFDPLAYAIELCHARGIELHAWFNPFRIRNLGYYELAKNSFAAKNLQYQHEYDNKRFFDPGFPQVREHIVKVILEVVRKYDIDAVLLDDYFYPYPVSGKNFPDNKTFARYGMEFYPKKLKDWRRNNIDLFIADLHEGIKTIKPNLPLGISPFGIWRTSSDDPNGSPLVKGTTSYDDLYADVYKWLSKDWIDYVIPQLYWEQGNRYGDFNALAKWWNDHSFGKPLYLGQALYRSTGSGKTFTNPKEISDQIAILRKYENIRGFAFFSASHLNRLPEAEMKELTALLNPKKDTIFYEPSVMEHTLTSVKSNMISDSEDLKDSIFTSSSVNNGNYLKIPIRIRSRRVNRQWQLTVVIPDSLKKPASKYFLVSYPSKKESGFEKKIYSISEKKTIFIPVEAQPKLRKDLFSIVLLNPGKSSSSQFFKIRRNRVVYQQ